MRYLRLPIALVVLAAGVSTAAAQTFDSRGFGEGTLFLYPQKAPNDPTRAVGEALFRYEPALKASWFGAAASFDARMDTHHQVERRAFVDWRDRTILRPPLSVRRLSATVSRGGLNLEAGKQFIRWGKADVLNPTDRFAPRDFLTVVDNEFLGVTGARLLYERRGNTVDLVWVPYFTPSRIPLFNQRWSVVPPSVSVPNPVIAPPGLGAPVGQSLPSSAVPPPVLPVVDGGARYPRGSQQGVRFNRSGDGYEFSVSFYNGFNYLPLVEPALLPGPARIGLTRVFPQMRMYGGDAAIPNRWFTVKGEFGYFTSTTASADEYGIYVVQLERQVGEWLFVGGYAGDFVTRTGEPFALAVGQQSSIGATQSSALSATPGGTAIPGFAADRGLARAFLGRAALTIDPTRSIALEGAVRQNGHGSWVKGEYSQAYGNHLRATFEGNWIRGREDDFLGQFHRNSNVNLQLRYSF